jgi:transposase
MFFLQGRQGGFMVDTAQNHTNVALALGPRRWREQRWLVDETIRSNGIEWDQPRLGYTLGPVVGEQSASDIAVLRTRIHKVADFVPAVSSVAERHEHLARQAEDEGHNVTAGEHWHAAAMLWTLAVWPLWETTPELLVLDERKNNAYLAWARHASHHMERVDVPFSHSLRAIFDAIFYVLRTGCPWRYLPCNFPPWQTVYYHFRRLRLKGTWFRLLTTLREAERERVGRNAHPSAAIMDAQSVKTVEESAGVCGIDAHKCVKGRKRHLLVDTPGLLLSVYVTPADLHDSKGAQCLLAGLAPLVRGHLPGFLVIED